MGENAKSSGKFDFRDPSLYLNRELTWLDFNRRVLKQAGFKDLPVLDRVKFIAIASSNLDEFFMKRIGGLRQQRGAGILETTVDGRNPKQQIEECFKAIRLFENTKNRTLTTVIKKLGTHGVKIMMWDDLSSKMRKDLRKKYQQNIFPLITPQAIDPAHPFPFVSNLSLNLFVSLRYKNERRTYARVKVPIGHGIPRFLNIGEKTFVPLEEVMANNLDMIFPGMRVDSVGYFRLTRNAITELVEEQADDLLLMIESEIRERKFAPVVRLQVDSAMSDEMKTRLVDELESLDIESDVFVSPLLIGQRDLFEIANLSIPELSSEPHHPTDVPAFSTGVSIIETIRDNKDVLVHHPYESFAHSVDRFVAEAAVDPKVRAIKMTLYRTSQNSSVIQSLMKAARNGKQVAVVVELKARFDEQANVNWAARLEQVGIHVTYGIVGLKTHCKVILVLRQEDDGVIHRYAHIGTGNYHSDTARLYADFGLFTANDDIGNDLTELFNYLTTGFKPGRKYQELLVAPKWLKKGLIEMIGKEVVQHKKNKDGRIRMKTNALEDPEIVEALYKASREGVKIELLVRDTCRLRPGIKGLSETVKVKSIVGKFLEHARVYYFHNGGKPKYYIGSADLMQRNLQSRVEVLVPVVNQEHREELDYLFEVQLNDTWNGWVMLADGSYESQRSDRKTSCHDLLQQRAAMRAKAAKKAARRATSPPIA